MRDGMATRVRSRAATPFAFGVERDQSILGVADGADRDALALEIGGFGDLRRGDQVPGHFLGLKHHALIGAPRSAARMPVPPAPL